MIIFLRVVSIKLGEHRLENGFLDAYFDPHYKKKNYDKEVRLSLWMFFNDKNIYRLFVVLENLPI